MLKTVKARVSQGKIEPLAPLPFEEGTEVEVTAAVPAVPAQPGEDPTRSTAGAWRGLLDCEAFEDDVYEGRLKNHRPGFSL